MHEIPFDQVVPVGSGASILGPSLCLSSYYNTNKRPSRSQSQTGTSHPAPLDLQS